jgi:hypothetical protein
MEPLRRVLDGYASGVTLCERGTSLLDERGKLLIGRSPGTGLVDILLYGRRVGSMLVNVGGGDGAPLEMDALTLSFGDTAEAGGTPVPRDESILSADGSRLTAVGVGETAVYLVDGGGVTAFFRVRAEQARAGAIEIPLGRYADIMSILSGLPEGIAREGLSLAQNEDHAGITGRSGMKVTGRLPGETVLSLLYGGREVMLLPISVTPAKMAKITLPLGVTTTLEAAALPGGVGASSRLSLGEDAAPGQGLLGVSGLILTANRPGETSVLIYHEEQLAATLPVEVSPTVMRGVQVEMGTSRTLAMNELPGYAADSSPTLQETGGGELLSVSGLTITGVRPGQTAVQVFYGEKAAAEMSVTVAPPVFADVELELGRRYEQQALPDGAVLAEADGNALLEVDGASYTAVAPGKTRVRVFYGETLAGAYGVDVLPARLPCAVLPPGGAYTPDLSALPGEAYTLREAEGGGLLTVSGRSVTAARTGRTCLEVLTGGAEAAVIPVVVTADGAFTLKQGETADLGGYTAGGAALGEAGARLESGREELLSVDGTVVTALAAGVVRVRAKDGDTVLASFTVTVEGA